VPIIQGGLGELGGTGSKLVGGSTFVDGWVCGCVGMWVCGCVGAECVCGCGVCVMGSADVMGSAGCCEQLIIG